MQGAQPEANTDTEYLRERVRSPSRFSVLLLLEAGRRAWSVEDVDRCCTLPRREVLDALASLARDGLLEEREDGHFRYAPRSDEDRVGVRSLVAAHRAGRLDSYAVLNEAAMRRIRQSARLLIRSGLHYRDDVAPTTRSIDAMPEQSRDVASTDE